MAGQQNPKRRSCGTMKVHRRMLDTVPGYAEARQRIEEQAFRMTLGLSTARPGCTKIPVVVHVVWKTPDQNISRAQIDSQIAVLNEDFRKRNADSANVPAPFAPLAGDARIEFELASTDPDGNPSDGITRRETDVDSFGDDDSMKFTASGGQDAWPADRYLNIWVCQLSGGLLGYAQFPGGAAATDGVVVTHTGFGTTGTASPPFDKGRTTTHEIGHWLNLRHIWGDDGDGCSGSDFVSDTPNQGGPNLGKPAFPNVSCSNGPNGDMFMNYMDYVDDDTMVMFSEGQIVRMQATLDGPRSAMGASIPCGGPVPKPIPKDPPKEVPKDPPKELPKDPPKELPKDLPKDPPKELPKDLPKDPPKELPKDPPKEAPKDPPKELPKDPPKEAPKDPPKELPKDPPKEAPKDPPKELPKDPPKEAPKDPPKELPKDPPKDGPKDGPFDPPKSIYEPPKSVFEPPKSIYEPPKSVYEPPKSIYEPPKSVFEPPKSIYEPPKSVYEPPKSVYEPPKSVYEPPKSVYEPPKSVYEPPKSVYEPPKSVYEPPMEPQQPGGPVPPWGGGTPQPFVLATGADARAATEATRAQAAAAYQPLLGQYAQLHQRGMLDAQGYAAWQQAWAAYQQLGGC